MLKRSLKFVSNNPLAATIVGTIIGGWILAQLLAMRAPNLGGVLGAVGGWLGGPAGSTRLEVITLVLLSILLGILFCVAVFLREYPELRQRKQSQAASPAHPLVPTIPQWFKPTPRQGMALCVLLNSYPTQVDLDQLCAGVKAQSNLHEANRALVAREMERLERDGVVAIDRMGSTNTSYQLTTAGRDWVLEDIGEPWNRVQRKIDPQRPPLRALKDDEDKNP